MTRLRAAALDAHPVSVPASSWRSGLARSVGVVRCARPPEPPAPLTLDHHLGATEALQALAAHGQGLALVATTGGVTSVVSAEDLRFAADWAGRRATVAHAVTQALVDLHAHETATLGSGCAPHRMPGP